MPLVTKQDDSKVDDREKDDRFVKDDKTFIHEGLGSGVQVETRARSVQYWSGNSMNDTGLAYNISGRATVIEASVGERLAGFQDPIKAIFGTTVCKDKTVIVKRKYVIGGGVTITPERAPARTVQVKEDVSSVELTRYGGDITMNTNLFLTPALAQAEMDMKVNAQKGELEKKLIELGYNEIISKAVRLPDAAVRANPTFHGVSGTTPTKENYAAMVYNRTCFGAFAKHEFPLANLLASCKKTGAYLAADGPSTLLVIPHGSSEMLRYTKKSSMQYSISGLSTADQKPVNMSISNVAEDPSSGVKIMVHVPPTDNASGAAFPTTSKNHLSETVTIYTFHRHKGAFAVNFETGAPYEIEGNGPPPPSPPGSGGDGSFGGPSMFDTPDTTARRSATFATKLSGLDLLNEALRNASNNAERNKLREAIDLCSNTSKVFAFLNGNPTQMASAIANAAKPEERLVHGIIGDLLKAEDSSKYATVASTLDTMRTAANATSKAEFNANVATVAWQKDSAILATNRPSFETWRISMLALVRPLEKYYKFGAPKKAEYDDFVAALSNTVGLSVTDLKTAQVEANRTKNAWLATVQGVNTRKATDFVQSGTNRGMLAQSSTAIFPQTLVESLTDEDYGLRALLAARLTFGAAPGALAQILASNQSTSVLESILAGARPHDFDALQNFMYFRMDARSGFMYPTVTAEKGAAFPGWHLVDTLFDVMVYTCIGLSADKITPGQSAAKGDMLHAVIAGYMPIVDSFETNLHEIQTVYEFIMAVGHEYAQNRSLVAASDKFSSLVDNFGDGDVMVPFTVLLHASFEVYEHERVTKAAMQNSFAAILRCGCTVQACVPGMAECTTSPDFSSGKVTYGAALKEALMDMLSRFEMQQNQPMCNAIQLSTAVALSRALLSPGPIVLADGGDNTGTTNAGYGHKNALSASAITLNAYVIANLAGINMDALVPNADARAILTTATDRVSEHLTGHGDRIFQTVLAVGRANVSRFATTFHTVAATIGDAVKSGAQKVVTTVRETFGDLVLSVQHLAEGIFSALGAEEWFKPIAKLLRTVGEALKNGTDMAFGGLMASGAFALASFAKVPEVIKSIMDADVTSRLTAMLESVMTFSSELVSGYAGNGWTQISELANQCTGVLKILYEKVPSPSDALQKMYETCLSMAAVVNLVPSAGGMYVHPAARAATLQRHHAKMVQLATSSSMIAPQGSTKAQFVTTDFASRVSGEECTVRRLKVKMSSAVIAKCGADTGELLVGYPMTGVSTNQRTESMTVALRVYLGAILKKPENVTIIPHVAFEGVVSCDFEKKNVTVDSNGTATFDWDGSQTVPYVPGADYVPNTTGGGGWTPLTTNAGALGHLDHFDFVDCVNGLQIYNSARGK